MISTETKKEVRIFHPRRDLWGDHFEWRGVVIKGITEKGRVTVELLDLNRRLILAIREEEVLLGRLSDK